MLFLEEIEPGDELVLGLVKKGGRLDLRTNALAEQFKDWQYSLFMGEFQENGKVEIHAQVSGE